MDLGADTIYVLHAVGRADLGLKTGPKVTEEEEKKKEQEETELQLGELRDGDYATITEILRSPSPKAPLVSASVALANVVDVDNVDVHLVFVATPTVQPIAQGLTEALAKYPDLYGWPFASVSIVEVDSLVEKDVAAGVKAHLKDVDPASARVVQVWGSGSTQVAISVLDGVSDSGFPWSLISIEPGREGRHEVFDPTAGLSVDPLVALLRRWRYHELIIELAERGEVQVNAEQRAVLEGEARQWGGAYGNPTASNTLALMAAALMRGDGTSGFAVMAHLQQRYQELRGDELDLLQWAEGEHRSKSKDRKPKPPTFGDLLGIIQRYTRDEPAVLRSRQQASGQWLCDKAVDALYEMSNDSRHEMAPPAPNQLDELRHYLAHRNIDNRESLYEGAAPTGLDQLSLLPAQTVCYVAIAGLSRSLSSFALAGIRDLATDKEQRHELDPQVRSYVGAPRDRAMDMEFLVLGTRSKTADAAAGLARALDHSEMPARHAVIEDEKSTSAPGGFTVESAIALLNENLKENVGAIVLVPVGYKPLVLSLMIAAHRVAARRGIPFFLRQIVDENEDVRKAEIHRLPLRFGTDRAVLNAALYALDIAEFDTAARLLGAMSAGADLARRAERLAAVLRCDPKRTWLDEFIVGTSMAARTLGLVADRLAVWATLARINDDAAVGTRAIVGACVAVESSLKWLEKSERQSIRDKHFQDLFAVRNKLPAVHGDPLPEGSTIHDRVRLRTNGRYTGVQSLLAGMVERAAALSEPHRPKDWPTLASVRDELRAELCRLLAAERDPSNR